MRKRQREKTSYKIVVIEKERLRIILREIERKVSASEKNRISDREKG